MWEKIDFYIGKGLLDSIENLVGIVFSGFVSVGVEKVCILMNLECGFVKWVWYRDKGWWFECIVKRMMGIIGLFECGRRWK